MASITARDAIAYATGEEWQKLYGFILAGWLLTFLGQFVVSELVLPLTGLLGAALVLTGTVIGIIGMVSGAFKLLADATQTGAEGA